MIPTDDQLAKLPRIIFPMPNKIAYMHDHGFYRGLPHAEWWIGSQHGDWTTLYRHGYGTKEKYGSGSIGIPTSSLAPQDCK